MAGSSHVFLEENRLVGHLAKQSFPMLGWSLLIFGLCEFRVRHQVFELQEHARRLVTEHETKMHGSQDKVTDTSVPLDVMVYSAERPFSGIGGSHPEMRLDGIEDPGMRLDGIEDPGRLPEIEPFKTSAGYPQAFESLPSHDIVAPGSAAVLDEFSDIANPSQGEVTSIAGLRGRSTEDKADSPLMFPSKSNVSENIEVYRTRPLTMDEMPTSMHAPSQSINVSKASYLADHLERRLNFMTVGTIANGIGCLSFPLSSTTKTINMDSTGCRGAANKVCTGCFVATTGSANGILQLNGCSTSYYNPSSQMSTATDDVQIVMIQIINTDPSFTLTVEGWDSGGVNQQSTYTMNAKDSVVGYCYGGAGGNDRIYFNTASLQNTATVNFAGKTIADGGTMTTAIINGGSINGMTMNGGTVNFASTGYFDYGTRTGLLNPIWMAAGKFNPGTSYSFQGSTLLNLGTVTTADIDGGTIDGVTIANTDITMSGQTLDMTSGTLTLTAGQIPATKIAAGTFNTGTTYSFATSTIVDLGDIRKLKFDPQLGGSSTPIIDVNTAPTPDVWSLGYIDITLTAGRTADFTAGTLTLGSGQVLATKVGAGTFNAGTYSFTGSTISDIGTVSGGTVINNVPIGTGTAEAGTFTTATVNTELVFGSGPYITFAAADIPISASGSSVTINGYAGTYESSTSTLASGADDSVTVANNRCKQSGTFVYVVVATVTGQCTSTGSLATVLVRHVDTADASGFIVTARNVGSGACTSKYKVSFLCRSSITSR